MNDFEKAQQVERGVSLLKEAEDECNSGALTKGFDKAAEALNIFLSVNDKKRVAWICRLLKGIDKQAGFDVGKELNKRGISFSDVCPTTKAEIHRLFTKPLRS